MRGFTLVEMMVVIAIMGIVGGMVFVNYRGNERQVVLDNAAAKVAQDIRRARELALRAGLFNCQPPGTEFKGYGIYFNAGTPTSYRLFAECNDNDRYNDPQDDLIGGAPIVLGGGVRIQSTTPNPIHILFWPPNPDMIIRGNPPVGAQAQGQVIIELGGSIRTVTITNAGTVKIE